MEFFFSIQDIFKSNNCRTDYLEIKDGYWHKSPVLGRYCGSGKIPELIKSTGSRMLVTLTTSMRQQGYRGFAANYEGIYRKSSSILLKYYAMLSAHGLTIAVHREFG